MSGYYLKNVYTHTFSLDNGNPLTIYQGAGIEAAAGQLGITGSASVVDGSITLQSNAYITGGSGNTTGFTGAAGVEVAGNTTINLDSAMFGDPVVNGGYNASGFGGTGIDMSGGGSLYIAGFASVEGGGGNFGGGTGVNVTATTKADSTLVTNVGDIQGGSGVAGAHSFGGFAEGGVGVSLDGQFAVLTNNGDIGQIGYPGHYQGNSGGVGGAGLVLSDGATAHNMMFGFVEGGNGDGSDGGNGVNVLSGSTFTNTGNPNSIGGAVSGGAGSGRDTTGGVGVYIGANSTVTNTAGGIFGGVGGYEGKSGNPGIGVELHGGTLTDQGMVSSTGTTNGVISGGVDYVSQNVNNIGSALQFDDGTSSQVFLSAGALLQGNIAGFNGGDNKIYITNVTYAAYKANPGNYLSSNSVGAEITTPSEGTLQFVGDGTPGDLSITPYDSGTGAGSGIEIQAQAACYRRGTRIRTANGEVAIENLALGDWVMTHAGTTRSVRWIGHRGIDCTRYADPKAVWPIRIQAGALEPQLPVRDLWVSPGHALMMEGVLIQAEKLVNGASIAQVPCDRVEYWHVELDTHDIVMAEGAPAESYLDTGNRTAFLNGGVFLEAFPDFKPKHWTETCLPLVMQGDILQRAQAQVRARAAALGYVITNDSDAHVVADGVRINPIALSEHRIAFMMPAVTGTIELRSRTFIPAHTCPGNGDLRVLGLCVNRLQLDGVDVVLDDASVFVSGWHAVERNAHKPYRWSEDRIPLPSGTRMIVMDLGSRSHFWAEATPTTATRWLDSASAH